jgi:hypothetical protein
MVQYWLDLFIPRTWEEAKQNNYKITGFREKRWSIVQKIEIGDILVCYITKISRFAGLLMVKSKPFKDKALAKSIWKGDLFPCLMQVEPIITLDFLHSVPSKEVISKLSIAHKWAGIVRGSPNRINYDDGKVIEKILLASMNEKIEYPLDTKVIKSPKESKSTKPQLYGQPMDFRGLRHAPINEQGVVYVFALVAQELGFRVEAIGTAYPDCEAIRQIDKSEKWQRVHIEFEYASSNFVTHKHPIEGCDLIVCWKHDWKECPIEVIELSSEIVKLGARL